MAYVSVPGMPSWGNRHCLLVLGVLGLSPCHGGGLRVPVLCGPQTWTSSFFQRLVYRAVLVHPRLLLRSRLLTRFADLPIRRHLSRQFLLSAGLGTVAAGWPREFILAPARANVQDDPPIPDGAQNRARVLGDVKHLLAQCLATSSAARILRDFQQLWTSLAPEARACLLSQLALRVKEGVEAPSLAQGGSQPPSVGRGSIKFASPILTPPVLDESPGTPYGVPLPAGNTSVPVGACVDFDHHVGHRWALRMRAEAPNSLSLSQFRALTWDSGCWGGRRHDQGLHSASGHGSASSSLEHTLGITMISAGGVSPSLLVKRPGRLADRRKV